MNAGVATVRKVTDFQEKIGHFQQPGLSKCPHMEREGARNEPKVAESGSMAKWPFWPFWPFN